MLKFDGQASHSYLYDEFGQLYSVNQGQGNADNFTDPHNAYTFSGTFWDEESGLNYYGARSYDSWSGTWNTQDIYRGSLPDPMSQHRYGFVKNNPMNFVDPEGYWEKSLSYGGTVTTPEVNIFDWEILPSYTIDAQRDWTVGFNEGVATASRSSSSGLATTNHTYTAVTQADAAVGYNNGPAYAYGAGVTLAKDNQVVYQKVVTGGNAGGYKALGVSGSQGYINWSKAEMNQKTYKETVKLKTERDQKRKEMEARERLIEKQSELLNSYIEAFGILGDMSPFDPGVSMRNYQLSIAILSEQAIANGFGWDSELARDNYLFRQYLLDRSAALRDTSSLLEIAFMGWEGLQDHNEYFEGLNNLYNNLPDYVDQLTQEDYYTLAQTILELREGDMMDMAFMFGMSSPVSVGSKALGSADDVLVNALKASTRNKIDDLLLKLGDDVVSVSQKTFNSVDELIGASKDMGIVGGNKIQREITGDGAQIFDDLANSYGAQVKTLPNETSVFQTSEGISVSLYNSSTNGAPTISVNLGDAFYKIRINP